MMLQQPPKPSPRSSALGFSLVSLSISLAVLSVLATTLIPTLASTSRLPLMEATVAQLNDFAHMEKLVYASSGNGTWYGADTNCNLTNPSVAIRGDTALGTSIVFDVQMQGSTGLCVATLSFSAPAWASNFLSRSLSMTNCPPLNATQPNGEHRCQMDMMPPQSPGPSSPGTPTGNDTPPTTYIPAGGGNLTYTGPVGGGTPPYTPAGGGG
jgi:type II secretory pathway pseudopilin PulG